MRTWFALGLAALVLGTAQTPAGQVVVTTQQQARPGMPARDAQQEKTGTAVIRGRVVAAETGSPLRRAQVRLTAPEVRAGRFATTDAQGRYEFKELPPGRYSLYASKAGYVDLQYGQRRPFESGKPIELLDAQVVDKADFALPRGSAITGRVLDEFGEPVAEAYVAAMRYQYVGGRRQLVSTGRGGQTNDLGQYRIYGLSPGDYYVSATYRSTGSFLAMTGEAASDETTTYAPTYYPGTANVADAQRLAVAIGQETGSVDFALLAVRTARISGIALGSDGKPATDAMVMLIPRTLEGLGMRMGGGASRVQKDGSFTISSVAPGEYTLQVRTAGGVTMVGTAGEGGVFVSATTREGDPQAPKEPEFATMPITVAGQDVSGLALTLGSGGTMTGKVVFEDAPPPDRERWKDLRIMARPAGLDLVLAAGGGGLRPVADDGSFEVTGIAGQVLVRPAGIPTGWALKAVEYNGLDVTDSPIEFKGTEEASGVRVVLTAQVSQVSGGVTDDRGQTVKDYTVVVFAEDSARWGPQTRFVKIGRPDQAGRFQIKDLPPADYLAVALDYVQSGEWLDPEFLARMKSKGTAFTLGRGETKVVELKPVGLLHDLQAQSLCLRRGPPRQTTP